MDEKKIQERIDRLLRVAFAQLGYMEKSRAAWEADPQVLEDKEAGAGSDNFTKFGRDMHALQPANMDFPAAWCDAFADWCFLQAFGEAGARQLLGDFDDYTVYSAEHFRRRGLWHEPPELPQPGDQIFFRNEQRICHTGLVWLVRGDEIHTVEGNTVSEWMPEGCDGVVARKVYRLSDERIAGWGRPDYGSLED